MFFFFLINIFDIFDDFKSLQCLQRGELKKIIKNGKNIEKKPYDTSKSQNTDPDPSLVWTLTHHFP